MCGRGREKIKKKCTLLSGVYSYYGKVVTYDGLFLVAQDRAGQLVTPTTF